MRQLKRRHRENKNYILTILILIILTACNQHWVRIEKNEKLVWKRQKLKNNKSKIVIDPSQCKYEKNRAIKVFQENGYQVYDYDSIRIYIRQEDKILNELTLKGY